TAGRDQPAHGSLRDSRVAERVNEHSRIGYAKNAVQVGAVTERRARTLDDLQQRVKVLFYRGYCFGVAHVIGSIVPGGGETAAVVVAVAVCRAVASLSAADAVVVGYVAKAAVSAAGIVAAP